MKRILALLMSVAILATCLILPVSAESGAVDEHGLSISQRQASVLYMLGINLTENASDITPDLIITRSEAAKYFCRMLGLKVTKPKTYEALYYDVTSEVKNYEYIKAITEAGYMNGYTNGKFGPDDSIAVKDAAKVLANIIGYGDFLKFTNINDILNKTGIVDGIPVTDKTTRAQFFGMIYNTLHAPAIRMTGVTSDGGADYTKDSKYLGLDHLFNVTYARGILNGIQNTRLDRADSGIDVGEVYMDSVRYSYNGGDEAEFLGYCMDYYFKKDASGINNIIYMAKSDRNEEITLTHEMIDSYNSYVYKYYTGDKAKTASINSKTYVILNGIAYPAYKNADMTPAFGKVTLIDNNNDGAYEVAKVDSYEFYLVSSVDTKNTIFYDVTPGVSLDLQTANEVIITWDGEEFPIERIINGNFLKVRRTPSTSVYYRAEVEVLKDERTYTLIESTKKDTFVGGGVEYTIWDKMPQKYRDYIKTGEIVTLYFADGMVVRVEKGDQGGANMGYLVDIHEEGDFGDTTIQAKIVGTDAIPVIYTLGKNVTIDGTPRRTSSDVRIALANGAAIQGVNKSLSLPYAQPLTFKLNNKGVVSNIDTLLYDSQKEDVKSFQMSVNGSYQYRRYGYSFYEGYTSVATLADTTVALTIPATNRGDDMGYSVFGTSDGDTTARNVIACNRDADSYIAEMVLVFEDRSLSVGKRSNIAMIVRDTKTEVNAEGEVVNTISAMHYNGSTIYDYACTDNTTFTNATGFDDIATGDIIRVASDKYGNAAIIELVYDVSTQPAIGRRALQVNTTTTPLTDASNIVPLVSGDKLIYGTPVTLTGNLLRISTLLPKDTNFLRDYQANADSADISGLKMFKYYEVRGIPYVEPASMNDIKTYKAVSASPSEVVYYTYGTSAKWLYIIERN